MVNKTIKKMQKDAEMLYNLRQLIDEKRDEYRKEMDILELERDSIEAILVANLKNNDLASLKVSSGDSFYIKKNKGINITNDALAFGWAYDNKAVSINKRIVAQILKESKEMPPGFDLVENESIGIKKKKVDKDEDDELLKE